MCANSDAMETVNKEYPEPSPLDETEKTEILLKSIGRYDFYINTTNTKASLVLAINGLLVGTTLIRIEALLGSNTPLGYIRDAGIYLFAAFGILTVLSLYFTFKSFIPFFSSGELSSSLCPSIFFFRSVASSRLDEFSARIKNLGKKECLDDLINQAHELATGLDIKMTNLRRAIYTTFLNVLVLIILVILRGYTFYGIGP